MPSKQNIQLVEALQEKIKRAKSIVLTEYTSLSLKEQTALRATVKEAGGELIVIKNTLLLHVIEANTTVPEEAKTFFQGQTAVLLSYEDELAPLKAVVTFAKDHERPSIKLGFMENKTISLAELNALAKLPGKKELLSTVIARIQSPLYGMVQVIQATTRSLVYAVEAVRKQKEAQG
jgi:large subunit ribosomal protein L10